MTEEARKGGSEGRREGGRERGRERGREGGRKEMERWSLIERTVNTLGPHRKN
jgi:hypothetical protein